MSTSVKIIADSISDGIRLTTMEVVCHRFVLAEFNTHRALSRNSASSRAIPVEKQLEKVQLNPAFPIEWPCEQPGMQGGNELGEEELADAIKLFEHISAFTINEIEKYLLTHQHKERRLHKSLINRLLEPFMWHTIVVTSTEWENFFKQRCSSLAQPEIRVLAEMMELNLLGSVPERLTNREWHLPYISVEEKSLYAKNVLIKASVARCARVSTLHHDGEQSIIKDLDLFAKLIMAEPPHWSPTEHVAQVFDSINRQDLQGWPGNFDWPWLQLRHNMGVLTK